MFQERSSPGEESNRIQAVPIEYLVKPPGITKICRLLQGEKHLLSWVVGENNALVTSCVTDSGQNVKVLKQEVSLLKGQIRIELNRKEYKIGMRCYFWIHQKQCPWPKSNMGYVVFGLHQPQLSHMAWLVLCHIPVLSEIFLYLFSFKIGQFVKGKSPIYIYIC